MSAFQMVLGIMVIIFGSIFGYLSFITYLNYRKKLLKSQGMFNIDSISKEITKQKMVIKDMESRIQTLESIVTKEDYELNQKFKKL